ncbi:MAG: hypothetical protein R3F35_09600 [Myxococcota bacterium]
MAERCHALYGEAGSHEGIVLALALAAKGLRFEGVPASPALAFALAARAGRESAAYLRTPDGCIFGDARGALDHLDRVLPGRAWRPTTPVRRVCARLLEDWIELWLPLWPECAEAMLERFAAHVARSGFLLGPTPSRPDGALAAWLETEVLCDPALHRHAVEHAPGLIGFAEAVRRAAAVAPGDAVPAVAASGSRAPTVGVAPVARAAGGVAAIDDAIPIGLLPILETLAADFLAYLDANREAIWDGRAELVLELDAGSTTMPAWRRFERRRAEIAGELARLGPDARRAVRQMLEPLGAWYVLTLPEVVEAPALGDPRGL